MTASPERDPRRGSRRRTRWDRLREDAARVLGAEVLAAAPVSPRAVRAPGRGAWGHPPLTGSEVRLLVVTPEDVVVFSLDRDHGGPGYLRLLRVETARRREEVVGVRLGRPLVARRFEVVLAGDRGVWDLEVSTTRSAAWGPVLDELGRLDHPHAASPVAQPETSG